MNVFFKPWVNSQLYNVGLKNLKILVVGASHYCKKSECQYFTQCTSRTVKDSSPYDTLCPHCDTKLSDSTIEAVRYFVGGDTNVSYSNFSDFMIETMGLASNRKALWDHIAFMNYVQYMLGSEDDIYTAASDIQDRDYAAFQEIVSQLSPDLIIAWGKAGEDIKHHRVCGRTIDGADANYIFDVDINDHLYRVIHCYHPCDLFGWFSNDIEKFSNQLSLLLSK